MYECLLEIGFEAEVNTKENPELLEMAQDECNENLATRATAITELRKMIFDREQCNPVRTDDEYMLRFLRARNFIVPRAHKLLVRYCTFREQNKHLYEGVDLWGLGKVNDVFAGTLLDRPDVGRLTLFNYGRWDPNELPIEDVMRAAFAVLEIGVRQPKLQVFGGTIIIDFEGATLKHFTSFTPAIAYQIVCLLGLAIPVRCKGVHVINYNWMLNTMFYILKKFVPRHAWEFIYFHGNDLKSLQQHLDLDCLPPKYGGRCRSGAAVGTWLKKIKKYRDEQFDREMKELGYVIKE